MAPRGSYSLSICRSFRVCLTRVAQVAERLHVREIGLHFRPDIDWRDVIGMKVATPGPEPLPQLFENRRRRRRSHPVLPEVHHDVGFPAALDAAPFIALETEDSEATVVLAVSALDRGATLLFETAPMNHAARPVRQVWAQRF